MRCAVRGAVPSCDTFQHGLTTGVRGNIWADHPLLAEGRSAAGRHGWRNRQGRHQLLVILGNPPPSGWPEMLAVGVREQDAGDEIRIERVDPVTECVENIMKGGAANDRGERALVDQLQRIAEARRNER